MGLFDNVNYPLEPCPKCGRMLNEWQTKDAADDEPYLRHIEVADIAIGGQFSGYCYPGPNRDQGCGTFVEYHLKPTGYTLERIVVPPHA